VRNLVAAVRSCHEQIRQLVNRGPDDDLAQLKAHVDRHAAAVAKICRESNATPAALPKPSRNAYALLSFLAQDGNLEAHVDTVRRVAELVQADAGSDAKVDVEMTHFANIWQREQRGKHVKLRLNEVFVFADDRVLAALVDAAMRGHTAANRRILDEYQLSDAAVDVAAELDLSSAATPAMEAGAVYHLGEVFDRVNAQYFDSQIERPRLTWNQSVTYRSFGHYVFATDTVLLSVSLDRREVPSLVIDFIMYHELLHKKHGVTRSNQRRMAHTAAFRRDEKAFPRRDEAEAFLQKYSRKLRSRR